MDGFIQTRLETGQEWYIETVVIDIFGNVAVQSMHFGFAFKLCRIQKQQAVSDLI